MSTDNEPKKPEGGILDSVFGDGTKNTDASNPMNAIKACVDFGFLSMAAGAVGLVVNQASEVLSNAIGGQGIGGLETGLANNLSIKTPELQAASTFKMPGMV